MAQPMTDAERSSLQQYVNKFYKRWERGEYHAPITYEQFKAGWPPSGGYWNTQTVPRYLNAASALPSSVPKADWLTDDQLAAAYAYMQSQNAGQPSYTWNELPVTDPAQDWLNQVPAPPAEMQWKADQSYVPKPGMPPFAPPGTPTFQPKQQPAPGVYIPQPAPSTNVMGVPDEQWAQMPAWMKFAATMLNQPIIMGAIQGAPYALLGGGVAAPLVGAGLGALQTPWAETQATGVAKLFTSVVGQSFSEQVFRQGYQKTLWDAMYFLNIPAEALERTLGLARQLDRPNEIAEVLQNLPAAWRAAHFYAETTPGLLTNVGPWMERALAQIPGLKEAWGLDPNAPYALENQVFMFPRYDEATKTWTVYPSPVQQQLGPEELTDLRRSFMDGAAREMMDSGMDMADVYMTLAQRYGLSGQLNDLVVQTVLDVGAERMMRKAVVPAIAKISRNALLQQATAIAKGRPIETLQTYSVLLRGMNDWEGRGWFDRFLAGVEKTPEGLYEAKILKPEKLSVFDRLRGAGVTAGIAAMAGYALGGPGAAIAGAVGGGVLGFRWSYLSKMDPKSRANELVNNGKVMLGVSIVDETDPVQINKILHGIGDNPAALAGELGMRALGSPEAAIFPLAMKGDALPKADGVLVQYQASRWAAQAVENLARILGREPAAILGELRTAPDAEILLRQLVDRARAIDAPEAKAVVAEFERVGSENATVLQDAASKFAGDAPAPFNLDEYKVKVMAVVEEALAQWAVKNFGVKPDPTWMMLGTTLKNAQSAIVLNLNPMYLVRGYLDNYVHLAATGLYGVKDLVGLALGGHDADLEYWKRVGITPPRVLGMGGPAIDVEPAHVIKDAADSKTALGSLNRWIRGKQGLGAIKGFSAALAATERTASMRGATNAFRQAFSVLYKPRGLDAAGEAILRAVNPDLPRLVRDSVRSAVSMDEINAVIKTGFSRRTVEAGIGRMTTTINRLLGNQPGSTFWVAEDRVRQMMDVTGLSDFMNARLKTATTDADVRTALNEFGQHVNDYVTETLKRHLTTKAEEAAAKVQAERFSAVLQIFSDEVMGLNELTGWNAQKWTDAFAQAEGQPYETGRRIFRETRTATREAWERKWMGIRASFEGIADGLGLDATTAAHVLEPLAQLETLWREFHTTKEKLWETFWNTKYPNKAAREAAYNATQDDIQRMYKDASIQENTILDRVYGNFVDGVARDFPEAADMARGFKTEMVDINRSRTTTMSQFWEFVRQLPVGERQATWLRFYNSGIPEANIPPYMRMYRDMVQQSILGLTRIYGKVAGVPDAGAAEVPVQVVKPGKGEAPPPPERGVPPEAVPVPVPPAVLPEQLPGMPTPAPAAAAEVVYHPFLPSEARRIAAEYGIPTAKPNGAPDFGQDRHILNVVNKYGKRKYTDLGDIPPDEVRTALELRRLSKQLQEPLPLDVAKQAVERLPPKPPEVEPPPLPVEGAPRVLHGEPINDAFYLKPLSRMKPDMQERMRYALDVMIREFQDGEPGRKLFDDTGFIGEAPSTYPEWYQGVNYEKWASAGGRDAVMDALLYMIDDAQGKFPETARKLLTREYKKRVYKLIKEVALGYIDRLDTEVGKFIDPTSTEALAGWEKRYKALADDLDKAISLDNDNRWYTQRIEELNRLRAELPADFARDSGYAAALSGIEDALTRAELQTTAWRERGFTMGEAGGEALWLTDVDRYERARARMAEWKDTVDNNGRLLSAGEQRQLFQDGLQRYFGYDAEQTATVMALADGVAQGWSQDTGQPVAEWWRSRIAGMQGGRDLEMLYQAGEAPVWYSQLRRTVEGIPQERMTAAQLKAALIKGGVKADELEWTGFKTWLDALAEGEKVTKADALAAMREVRVEERIRSDYALNLMPWYAVDNYGVKIMGDEDPQLLTARMLQRGYKTDEFKVVQRPSGGPTRYAQYVEPGGENYRELLFTLPVKEEPILGVYEVVSRFSNGEESVYARFNTLAEAQAEAQAAYRRNQGSVDFSVRPMRRDVEYVRERPDYMAPHWAESNVFAHVRMDDRIDADGKRVLFVEEVQSEWHQEGRERGYQTGGVPPAPFSKTWHELVMKRVLRMAAEGDYDRVEWTTGEQQVARYPVNVTWEFDGFDPIAKERKWLLRTTSGGDVLVSATRVGSVEDIAALPGEMTKWAPKIWDAIQKKPEGGTMQPLRAGMEGFYDKMLVDWANKYTKKWGAQVGEAEILTVEVPTTSPYVRHRVVAQMDGYAIEGQGAGGGSWNVLDYYDTRAEADAALAAFESGKGDVYKTVHSLDITPAMRESVMQGQPMFQEARGGISFLDDQRAIFTALTNPNISTVPHELGHLFRRDMTRRVTEALPERQAELQGIVRDMDGWVSEEVTRLNELATKGELTTTLRKSIFIDSANKAIDTITFSDEQGNWTRAAEEIFARGFERYLAAGVAPTPGLRAVFERFKRWLMQGYANIVASGINIRMTERMKRVFDRMFTDEQADQFGQMRNGQRTMFAAGEELPLFTGTAQRATAEVFRPQEVARQEAMFPIGPEMKGAKPGGEAAGAGTLFQQGFDQAFAYFLDAFTRQVKKGAESLENRVEFVRGAIMDEPEYWKRVELWRIVEREAPDVADLLTAKMTRPATGWRHTEGGARRVLFQTDSGITMMQEGDGTVRAIPPGDKPVEGTRVMENPPGTVEGLQTSPPYDDMMIEGWETWMRPFMQSLEQYLLSDEAKAPTTQFGDLPPEAQSVVKTYFGQVKGDMADAKLGALRFAESRRDAALLNYGKRYGFDNILMLAFPYEFWMTRSAWEWALRSLDHRLWFSSLYRLKQFQEHAVNSPEFPARLRGKINIGMLLPFLPDWASDFYIDPFRVAYPFTQILRPIEQAMGDKSAQTRRAGYILQRWISDESVDQTQATAALSTHTGTLWDKAITQARMELDSNSADPFDYMSTLLGWSLPLTWAYYGLTGQGDKISALPPTRAWNAITAALGLNQGRGFNLEGPTRRLLGMPEYDEYSDFRVDRELSNMVADGEITADVAQQTMITRQGDVFIRAQARVAQQTATRYSFAVLAGDVFPEGEQEMRALKEEYEKALSAYSKGDMEAKQHFWDAHPEYAARQMIGDDPEQKLRTYLRSIIFERYYSAPNLYAKQAREAMGKNFVDLFLNKETRNYDAISTATLTMWANMLKPGVAEQLGKDVAQEKIEFATPAIANAYQAYRDERDKRFPNIYEMQQAYYEGTTTAEDGSVVPNSLYDKPEILTEYENWNNTQLATHPEIIPYAISPENRLYSASKDVQVIVYQYRMLKQQQFPFLDDVQDEYYAIPEDDGTGRSARKAWKQQNPDKADYMTAFYDWRRSFMEQWPQAIPYIMSEQALANAVLGGYGGGGATAKYGRTAVRPSQDEPISDQVQLTYRQLNQFSPALISQLYAYFYANEALESGAVRELTRIWEGSGSPNDSLYEWLDEVVRKSFM